MRRALPVLLILTTGCIGRLVTPGGETELGRELAEKVEQQLGLVESPALQSYIQEVGVRLATASPKVRDSLDYHCRVIDMEPPNAFALPGGYIYISRGILPLFNAEDELANVLAHEIAHVSERHHLQHALRRTPFVPVDLATGISAFAVGVVSPLLGRAVSAVGRAPGGLVLASYSRGQESEADAVGQEVAASAGWDPAAMPQVMESLALEEKQRGGDPERRSYFATHPTSPDRARKTAQRAESFAIAEANPIAADRRAFLSRLDGLLVGTPAREGVVSGREFLHPELDFRIAFPPGWKIADDGRVVRAIAENQDAVALITIVGEGSDPGEVARRVIDKASLEVEQGPAVLRIGRLEAVRAVARHSQGGARFRYVLTWLAHDGHVYQISAGAYEHAFEARGDTLDAVARSFRRLESGDWPRIREGRLRIVAARGGESLSDLLPAEGAWSLEQTAVANRLAPDAVLEAGALVKVAPLERYVREAKAE